MSVSIQAIDPLAYLVGQVRDEGLGAEIESVYSGNQGRRRSSASSSVPRVIEHVGDVITGGNSVPRKRMKFKLSSHSSERTREPGLFGLKPYRPRSPKQPRPKPPREKKVKPPKAPKAPKKARSLSKSIDGSVMSQILASLDMLQGGGGGINRTDSKNLVKGGLVALSGVEIVKLGVLKHMLTTMGANPIKAAEFDALVGLMGIPNNPDHELPLTDFLDFCYLDAPRDVGPVPHAPAARAATSKKPLAKTATTSSSSLSSSDLKQPVVAARKTSSSSSSSSNHAAAAAAAAAAGAAGLGYTSRTAGSYTYTWMESYLSTARDTPATPGHRAHAVGVRPGEGQLHKKRGCCDDEYATNYGGSRHRKHFSTWCSKPKRAVSCDSFATVLLENQRGDRIRKTRINWIDMLEEDWRAYPPEPCQKTGVALYSMIPEVYLPPHQRPHHHTIRDEGYHKYTESYYRQSYEQGTARSAGRRGNHSNRSGGRGSARRSARPRHSSQPPQGGRPRQHRDAVPAHSPFETQHHHGHGQDQPSPTYPDRRVTHSGRDVPHSKPLDLH